MIRIIIAAFAALTVSISLYGCQSTKNNTFENDMTSAMIKHINISEGASKEMRERSILYTGDITRLSEKLKKAKENPKQLTKITFLGDSITQGSSASSVDKQYTELFRKWWENKYGPYCEFKNAGIGATDSYLGVHRVDEQVLSDNPDIIFIEFINDTNTEFFKISMDSLVRKCLSLPNKPAVVMIEMTLDNGDGPQEIHSEIAKAYGIPVISYHDVVMPEVKSGAMKWSDISPDNVHPNDNGHKLLAELLEDFFIKVESNEVRGEQIDFPSSAPTVDKFKNAHYSDRTSSEIKIISNQNFDKTAQFMYFQNGWATEKGGSIEFEMEFQNLGIAYLKTVDGKGGTINITIDGEEYMPITSDFGNGWGNYIKSDEIYSSDKPAKHKVKISVDKDSNNFFSILAWLVS